MIRVVIDSIRVSLMSPHRVILLREVDSERRLPIWIGPFETDAIVIELQQIETSRPLTHDLLTNVISVLGGEMSYVLVNDLKDDHFTARVFIQKDGSTLEVDARPSDAVAVAVRANVPVFVAEKVMDEAGIYPEEDIRFAADKDMQGQHDVFADFLDTLDVDSDE